MFAKPLLSDLPIAKTRPRAGDRVLIRTSFFLDKARRDGLSKSVRKFFNGEDVRILFADCSRIQILWQKRDGSISSLVSLDDFKIEEAKSGNVTLDCSTVEIVSGDVLIVSAHAPMGSISGNEKAQLKSEILSWAGVDVEFIGF